MRSNGRLNRLDKCMQRIQSKRLAPTLLVVGQSYEDPNLFVSSLATYTSDELSELSTTGQYHIVRIIHSDEGNL